LVDLLLLLQAHARHVLFKPRLLLLLRLLLLVLRASRPVKLAERDAAVLILRCHPLPLLDGRDVGLSEGLEGIRDRRRRIRAVRVIVKDVDEAYGDQARAAQSADGLGDDPFLV